MDGMTEVILKLVLSAVLGGLIGLEREMHGLSGHHSQTRLSGLV